MEKVGYSGQLRLGVSEQNYTPWIPGVGGVGDALGRENFRGRGGSGIFETETRIQ